MIKHLKSNIFIIVSSILLCAQPVKLFAAQSTIEAIEKMKTAVVGALNNDNNVSVVSQLKTNNKQVVGLFDETFKGQFDARGKLTNESTLMKIIRIYAENFYQLFTTNKFSSLGFPTLIQKNKKDLEKLQAKIIGYNFERGLLEKETDDKTLLAQPVEDENNNFDRSTLGLPQKDKKSSPYGSLGDETPIAENAPNIESLIGPDRYTDKKAQDKAKLFIEYVKQTSPPPKNIHIPPKKGREVTIYLPYESENKPYTAVTVSTTPKNTGGNSGFGFSGSSRGGDSDYEYMIRYLQQRPEYQKIKSKMRAINMLRSLYLEGLTKAYQDRVVDSGKKEDESLAEKEKKLALSGLDPEYYEELKKKSMADFNMELLKSVNTLTYFMWKIHKDNELNALMIGASGLKLATTDVQDDMLLKNIKTLIENKCWDKKNEGKKICRNPASAAIKNAKSYKP